MNYTEIGVVAQVIIAVLGLVYTARSFWAKQEKEVKEEVREDEEAKNEMELKIAALEKEMATQYQELSVRLSGIEATINENKLRNSAFESRILSGVDKLENKIERLQDLMVKAVLNNNQTTK